MLYESVMRKADCVAGFYHVRKQAEERPYALTVYSFSHMVKSTLFTVCAVGKRHISTCPLTYTALTYALQLVLIWRTANFRWFAGQFSAEKRIRRKFAWK